MNRWAMIKDTYVINICIWDGSYETWQPPENIVMEPAPDEVSIGWRFVDGEWLPPVEI